MAPHYQGKFPKAEFKKKFLIPSCLHFLGLHEPLGFGYNGFKLFVS